MIAKNTVYLSEDRKTAVAEGDPAARFLLVRAGSEIADAALDKYEGAAELVSKAAEAQENEDEDKPKGKRGKKE